MTNWIYNRVYFKTEKDGELDEIVDKLKGVDMTGKETALTFESFIPMPEPLREVGPDGEVFTGYWYLTGKPIGFGISDEIAAHLMKMTRTNRPVSVTEEQKTLGRKALENEKQFGFRTWFDWRDKNWGTVREPWDVILERQSPYHLIVSFVTGTSAPEPVARAMKEVFGNKLKKWLWCGECDWEVRTCGHELHEIGFRDPAVMLFRWEELNLS